MTYQVITGIDRVKLCGLLAENAVGQLHRGHSIPTIRPSPILISLMGSIHGRNRDDFSPPGRREHAGHH